MQVTYGELYRLNEPMVKLLKASETMKAKDSIKIAELVDLLKAKMSLVNTEYNKLIGKYGEKGEGGRVVITEKSTKWPTFIKEVEELFVQITEIEVEKITIPAETMIGAGTLIAMKSFVGVE